MQPHFCARQCWQRIKAWFSSLQQKLSHFWATSTWKHALTMIAEHKCASQQPLKTVRISAMPQHRWGFHKLAGKEAQKLRLKLAWSANARLCSTLQDYLSNTYLVHGKSLTHKTPQKMNVQFDATFEHFNLNFEYYSNLNNSNQFCLSCQGQINISWQYTSADNHNHSHAVSKSILSNLSIQLCTLLF